MLCGGSPDTIFVRALNSLRLWCAVVPSDYQAGKFKYPLVNNRDEAIAPPSLFVPVSLGIVMWPVLRSLSLHQAVRVTIGAALYDYGAMATLDP